MANIELLDATMAAIDASEAADTPLRWDQAIWWNQTDCGTAMCFAGFAAHIATGSGRNHDRAAELLDLSQIECSILFGGERTLPELHACVEWLAGRAPLRLRGASLRCADLRGASLRCADLGGANLREADLRRAYLRGADLREADLSGAYLRGADLSEADLRGADLSEADLSGAYLRGADLSEVNLRGAHLRGANLSGADLYSANLSSADLSGADLTNAIGVSRTIPGKRYVGLAK